MATLPGPLVGPDWLRRHLADEDLRVVDLRWSLTGPPGQDLYAEGHVPGAVFLDLDADISAPRGKGPGRHPIPDGRRLAEVLGAAGIGDEARVVAYDDASGSVAARLWWLFRHFGHDGALAILDGGLAAWVAAGGELATAPAPARHATWTPRDARTDDVVDASFLVGSLRERDLVLLDARAGERYRGEVEPVDPRAGHIPGAVSLPWNELLDADGRLLAAERLRARFEAAGATPQRDVVAYCGSGVNASYAILALDRAGIRARLYEGSWSDWSSDPNRPVATGPSAGGLGQ